MQLKALSQLDGVWHHVEAYVFRLVPTKAGWRVLLHDVYLDGERFRDHLWSPIPRELHELRARKKVNISFQAQISSYERMDGSTGLYFDRMRNFRKEESAPRNRATFHTF